MFTEGLDRNAIKWAREGSFANNNKMEFSPFSTASNNRHCSRVDPIRNGGRGFGLPPASKFRSGHLPSGVIPAPRAVPIDNGGDSELGSDMDIASDSDDEIYGGRYSLESSPQADLASSVPTGPARRLDDNKSMPFRPQLNLNSSKQKHQRPIRYSDRNCDVAGEEEEEGPDSTLSSECASTRMGSNQFSMMHRDSYASDGYSSSVPSRPTVAYSSKKDVPVRGTMSNTFPDDEVPSAPPFWGAGPGIDLSVEHKSSSSSHSPIGHADSNRSAVRQEQISAKTVISGDAIQIKNGNRSAAGAEPLSSGSLPARLPSFHACGLGPWYAVISYDACVRLCLHLWARGCEEAPIFLESECALLRKSFNLQQVLLQSEGELLAKRSSDLVSEGAAPKPRKTIGKMKVQVRKVKTDLDLPTGCSFSSLKPSREKREAFRYHLSNLQSTLSSGWAALRTVHVVPQIPAHGSFSKKSLAYVHAGTEYLKQVSEILKVGITTLRSGSSYEVVQETYSCLLRLKSSVEEEAVRMQPGSGETHVFLPDSLGDDLIIEVQDSKGNYYGRVVTQVATVAEDPGDKVRWWSIYREPEHELVGRLQLYINYSTSIDDNGHLKCGTVAETVAYDLLLEVAMKVQHFQQRNLLIHGPWKWLLTEFASYYGVSDAYARLRYLSYVMDVATPTSDCLTLVHDLMLPVIMRGDAKSSLSHQENRILGEILDEVEQILSQVFENYKSLDESSPSGMMDTFKTATGIPAPALAPTVKLYTLLHDILSPEAQLKLCGYFQTAAKKRSKRNLTDTDEFVANNNEGFLMDVVTVTTAYQKMKSLCLDIRNEILTDIDIQNSHVFPSFIDLPNISSSIFNVELCNRLRAFLVACPPSAPSPPVAELVIATSDFQRDLSNWNIKPVKGGVDAKELFHLYIIRWIQDKRLALLESCKLDRVKWSGARTQHSTTPFVDDMYDRLKETLNEYEVIISRWPEYTFVLENAIADVEKAVIDTLDKQYADILSPLKDSLTSKTFGLKYVQKLAKRSDTIYVVPEELGILLNSMKRMLDVLRPRIETQIKSWGSCIPDSGNAAPGERLSEVTVMLRAKFRNYLQAVVEKLADNTKLQNTTKLKRIIQEMKETVIESDVRSQMQPLKDQLTSTIDHLHTIFETHVFVAICRGYWDRMGQDVLSFLVNRKENRSWYKGSRIAVSILDDTFASQMQQLLGNMLQEKDLEPPRSVMEVRSVLCKDAPNHINSNYFY